MAKMTGEKKFLDLSRGNENIKINYRKKVIEYKGHNIIDYLDYKDHFSIYKQNKAVAFRRSLEDCKEYIDKEIFTYRRVKVRKKRR